MKTIRILILLFTAQLYINTPAVLAAPKATDTVSSGIRCSVCGMYLAKYPDWVTQIHYDDLEKTRFFDGVKDMMAYYFRPERYNDTPPGIIKDLFVKDYHSHAWLSAKEAFYVVGSDVFGPMGYELIPFSSKEAAQKFLKEHKGQEVLSFGEITLQLVEALRQGQRMH